VTINTTTDRRRLDERLTKQTKLLVARKRSLLRGVGRMLEVKKIIRRERERHTLRHATFDTREERDTYISDVSAASVYLIRTSLSFTGGGVRITRKRELSLYYNTIL